MMLAAAYFIATLVLCAMAGEIGSREVGGSVKLKVAMVASAIGLSAYGLWWPARALQTASINTATSNARDLFACVPCVALAAFGYLTANRLATATRVQALGPAAAVVLSGYVLAMTVMPGMFRLAPSLGLVAVTIAVLLLGASSVAVHARLNDGPTSRLVRLACALVTAAVGLLASAASTRSAANPDWTQVIDLVQVCALAAALMITSRRATADPGSATSSVRQKAAVDSLTGLPTRLFFEERMRAEAKRSTARKVPLAVLFIDLDGFKPVNDTFGHSCGDRVLSKVGRRLRGLTRRANEAARIGGDEFLLLMPNASSLEAVTELAQRAIDTLCRPYKIDEREVTIACSIGIAILDGGGPGEVDKLIARADVAMYAAKRAGGSRHCFYAPSMDNDAQQNFEMVRDLRKAIEKNELELFFQPKMDARTGKVTAAEALLRWNHPEHGIVMPDRFIPLAERTGLIGSLGNWVIEAACVQAQQWREHGLRMRVAINLSAHQMRQDDIADRIAEALKRHKVHPSLLTCEITESAAMEDTGATQETFRRLGALGAHVSIDDFGTGYSSLAYLRKLPAEELKIDRSFVTDLEHSADARAVVDAVLKLAHALGLKVVAEGVENQRQQQILTSLGCDELQGFLFARPMTARSLLLWALGEGRQAASFNASLFDVTRGPVQLPAIVSVQ